MKLEFHENPSSGMDFREILYLSIFRKSVDKIQAS